MLRRGEVPVPFFNTLLQDAFPIIKADRPGVGNRRPLREIYCVGF